MKNLYFFSSIMIFFGMTFQANAQLGTSHLLNPGVTEINRVYYAPFTATPPVIDGDHTDAVWDLAPWRIAQTHTPQHGDWNNGTPVLPEGSFQGEADLSFAWKMLWDNNNYYLLMKHVDDHITYSDIHNGYPGNGNKFPPHISPAPALPNTGSGDGTIFHYWRMDQISLWMTYWDEVFYSTSFNRNNQGVWHSFYPGAIHSTQSWSVLAAAKHVGGENHIGNAAGKHVSGTNERYIEFKDKEWGTMFVNKLGFSVKSGDTLIIGGEINEADGVTNRRDYLLTLSTEEGNGHSVLNSQTLIILTSATNVESSKTNTGFEIYPNPNRTGMLRLNKNADISIYSLTGQEILRSFESSQIDISGLQNGVYMVKDNYGNVKKLIKR